MSLLHYKTKQTHMPFFLPFHFSLSVLPTTTPKKNNLFLSPQVIPISIYNKITSYSIEMDKMMNNIMIWKLGSHERDAIVAKEAIQQGGSGLKAIVEIFIGRKSTHISLIKQAYYHRYGTHLDQDVLTLDPPHPFQKVI